MAMADARTYGVAMFEVATNYDRFMGRFSEPLADALVAAVEPPAGARCLDVGCGPGALTAVLVGRLGADRVVAVDPSEPFVAAARERFPSVDVRRAPAEELPFEDDTFDVAFASLVVHFMADPVAGLREMGRVVKPGGVVAATVWDFAGGHDPLGPFWHAVLDLDPGSSSEAELPGARQGGLVDLADRAGLVGATERLLTIRWPCARFEDWWEPFTLGVGPAGSYVAGLDDDHRAALREHCRSLLPTAPFDVEGAAWAVLAQSAAS